MLTAKIKYMVYIYVFMYFIVNEKPLKRVPTGIEYRNPIKCGLHA